MKRRVTTRLVANKRYRYILTVPLLREINVKDFQTFRYLKVG